VTTSPEVPAGRGRSAPLGRPVLRQCARAFYGTFGCSFHWPRTLTRCGDAVAKGLPQTESYVSRDPGAGS